MCRITRKISSRTFAIQNWMHNTYENKSGQYASYHTLAEKTRKK
jgi:hypothetical protein